MSELLLKPGEWYSINAGQVESFLSSVAILLGLTPKRKKFLEQVYHDIHGPYEPDQYYHQIVGICGNWPPNMQLSYIIKECRDIEKKQLKIWYTELLAMEPMDDINPFFKMMLPSLSNTINTF